MKKVSLAFGLYLFAGITCAGAELTTQDQPAKNDIADYLVDIGSTPISAGDLVGLSSSAITNIQSAHDLTAAISPLATGSGKAGFGLAVTPARINIQGLALPFVTYVTSNWARVWGATTVSYAENSATITSASFRKSAWSVGTTYYINRNDDAVIATYNEFNRCTAKPDEELARLNFRIIEFEKETPNYQNDPQYKLLKEEHDKAIKKSDEAWTFCRDTMKKPAWNANKVALSLGAGRIKPEATAGLTHTLGSSLLIGGVFGLGTNGAAYATVRRTVGEIDLNTVVAGIPTYSSHTIGAIRLAYGFESDSTLRILAEISSVSTRNTTVTTSTDVFKYAVGADKKLADGVWVEFRVGRKRTADGLAEQTASLLSLNWSPTSTLPTSKPN